MDVKIGTEAAQFPGKEDINEIFLAVQNKKWTNGTAFSAEHSNPSVAPYTRQQFFFHLQHFYYELRGRNFGEMVILCS